MAGEGEKGERGKGKGEEEKGGLDEGTEEHRTWKVQRSDYYVLIGAGFGNEDAVWGDGCLVLGFACPANEEN